ncbi:hypothetical protein CC117_29925 [Parafrankia colletiae]|uniref:Uncharacterized protein n=1 Tax=Parafrankia colletiae TaxID=573497 RepID=A0A1S1Q581_9ACTN|nr:hypothetical protein [Parafrankia colletiae]MCK9904000.1 hypothetical protein [Frankia sp. Cpl3]OHV28757.1 hypothetical protein CC117_29925 [Parafrankia colletiae]
MNDLPPWIGGVTVGMMFLATGVIITYTLVPLPGQESLGGWNYVIALAIFVINIRLRRMVRMVARRIDVLRQVSRRQA